MDMQSAFTRKLASVVGLLIASTLATAAEDDPTAVVLYVANNTVHNGTGCGSAERPCRSISQAIANAADGSLIEVGPGIYGDIDGDGDASSAGEEAPVASGAVVKIINKSLVVYSKAGAAQTIIRAPLSFFRAIVWIDADNVTFGRPNGGFTVVGTKPAPMAGAVGIDARGANITIAGNIVTDATLGAFVFDLAGGDIDALRNVATRNDYGFVVAGMASLVGRLQLEGNIASDNEFDGFVLRSGRIDVVNNLATRNRTGFSVLSGRPTITGNVAVANTQFGIESRLGGELMGNSVIGNGIAGIRLLADSCGVHITRNNIFGNGEAAAGCGLINEGCGPNATDNY